MSDASDDAKPPAGGSTSLRPIFLGNLDPKCSGEEIRAVFADKLDVERIDVKRGYAFVFLKDVASSKEKEDAEQLVSNMNGRYVRPDQSYFEPAIQFQSIHSTLCFLLSTPRSF